MVGVILHRTLQLANLCVVVASVTVAGFRRTYLVCMVKILSIFYGLLDDLPRASVVVGGLEEWM